jgi:uncharacterized protein
LAQIVSRIGRPRISPALKRMILAAVTLLAIGILLIVTATFWVNWWWFDSMGYRTILTTRYFSAVVSFVIGAAVTWLVFGGNVYLAFRLSVDSIESGRIERYASRALAVIAIIVTLVLSVVSGLYAATRWEIWQLALRGESFGVRDPVFDRDAGFYIFQLPALIQLHQWLVLLVTASGLAVLIVYLVRYGVRLQSIRSAPRTMNVHLFSLIGALIILLGIRYLFQNYELVFSTRSAAFGAGYTDVNVQRWTNYALVVISFVIGGILLLNGFVSRIRPLAIAVGAWVVTSLVLGIALPAIVQQTLVEPNQLRREGPYISNNIEMTRAAYALDDGQLRDLAGTDPLRGEDLRRYPETLNNIRLWDYRIIQTTYQQLQAFVPYFTFVDVDVDRYMVDDQIQQVLVSARELDIDGLVPGARTWTNRHLVYTHGYGVVGSPVGQVTGQGLPDFVVHQMPPVGEGPYEVTRPEIYFGELGGDWVAVNTEQQEFSGDIGDDPGGDTDYVYEGAARGSIAFDSFLKRTLTALHFRDRNLYLSDQLTNDSRIIFHRDIVDRVSEVAPFLELDPDPYLIISDGRLFWLIDAYTTTDRYPYATPFNGLNYIRNSVKVLVDAYNGDVTLYRTGTPDPIADAYDRIYGGIMEPITEIPFSIAEHFRYPEMMYDIQSLMYTTYHVTNPTDFYNGEDRWAIPEEQVTGPRGQMEPYYVTMTLPEEENPSFALIRPFIPGGATTRQNMTAWMGGRVDAEGRPELIVYRFPRQVTIFGPSQIAARIDQEPDIAAQITLWNQSGSSVIRGNLLVIPVGDSILYVQPLYLEATESQGALPELRRVIAASSDRVVMEPTLVEALIAVTEGVEELPDMVEEIPGEPSDISEPDDVDSLEELAAQAIVAFEEGQRALAQGDWTAYGEAQAELQAILAEMEQRAGAGTAPDQTTPAPNATPEATAGST